MTTDTLTTVSFLVTSIFLGERCSRGLPVTCLTCRLSIALSPSVANPYGYNSSSNFEFFSFWFLVSSHPARRSDVFKVGRLRIGSVILAEGAIALSVTLSGDELFAS